MTDGPHFDVSDDQVRLRVAEGDASQRIEIECVVDRTLDGHVVGFEIMDLKRQTGAALVPAQVTETFRWSYDPEIDAAYFHLQPGPAPVQTKTTATVLLNAERQILELCVALGDLHTGGVVKESQWMRRKVNHLL